MSTGRTVLRHPLVIAGAALGLILVALLNIHTFAGVGDLLGIGSGRRDTHLAPPPDLAAFVQDAVRADRPRRLPALAGLGSGLELARDPFRDVAGAVAAAPPSRPETETTRPQRRAAADRPLVCSAVFLGGARPQALIDGETFGPGDTVRGLEITRIDTDGVWLQRPDGSLLHLDLGPAASSTGSYPLVIDAREGSRSAPTALAGSRTTGGSE